MKFEDSKYSRHLAYKKETFSFGTVYVTEHFLLSEFNEGIHVDNNIAKELVSRFSNVISKGIKIGYIANRYNSYSFDPQLWVDFNKDYDAFVASAIVTYSNFSYLNASLEKKFFNKSLKRCKSVEEAIEWVLNLEEFKTGINQN
ncbi:hypothetical protein ADIWIN_1340 [Winogradskyella psychrotolerans RS-3]|uniref:STAS/SEC14 domain-containing protein n=1 Tax=Winogradskyella psychrotolerans RS-3 TaxID=641526 RepID=S7XCI4_9FLAO|nr:hypothetical protein [Winogradskyella psychrotolerans]EPR73703.1 hypothetical protein ADIWIN_1340 [Winogradskyella psychrotolerans RS-3]